MIRTNYNSKPKMIFSIRNLDFKRRSTNSNLKLKETSKNKSFNRNTIRTTNRYKKISISTTKITT
jgi:hypothetical protein